MSATTRSKTALKSFWSKKARPPVSSASAVSASCDDDIDSNRAATARPENAAWPRVLAWLASPAGPSACSPRESAA